MPSTKSYKVTQTYSNDAFTDDYNVSTLSAHKDAGDTWQKNVAQTYSNEAFTGDSTVPTISLQLSTNDVKKKDEDDEPTERDQWSKPIEFLLSCIAMSVGLGNVWRFPFRAYENGGGAFLIPYIIVLFTIGKPLYFMELSMGQFCSYGYVKVWNVVPIAKGVGYGQAIGTSTVITYYCSLMALTVYYFCASFQSQLPWTYCDPTWATDTCYESGANGTRLNLTGRESSSEQYFRNKVLKISDGIDGGIGFPDWQLSLCLLFSWAVVFVCMVRGVKSSGKAAYFLAVFPYIVLVTLLVRGATLPGAATGIMYFIKPKWDQLLTLKVWFAAVIQCFYSLSVGFGSLITYASFNTFRHNVYRDAMIISIMDMMTSLLAGFTIFAVLGSLAEELHVEVDTVVKSGTGLAFISYPEAIAKFKSVPQLFAVLFFFMLFTLGLGSAMALINGPITIVCDQFPHWKRWAVTGIGCLIGFSLGLVYVTPGGQYILNLVDFYGGGMSIIILEIIEVIMLQWIYGLRNFTKDIEFMLGIKMSLYWKFCWGIFIPIALLGVFLYSVVTLEELKYSDYVYPAIANVAGWIITVAAVIMFPLCLVHAILTSKGDGLLEKMKTSLQHTDEWAPKVPKLREEWLKQKMKK